FVITPVVVLLDDEEDLRPCAAEVAAIHRVPVRRLCAPDLPRWQPQPDGAPLLQMPLAEGMTIHAPTGALLYQFREVALRGRHTRVFDARQPRFTRS
ncbi:MAG: NUDIX hydrolase, partial [Sciscionella sp.]